MRDRIELKREDWISNPTMLYFWVHLLFMADENGVVETSLSKLAGDLRLSVRQVRTCLSRTLSDKRATHQTTKQGTKITIYDYDSYKGDRQTDRQTMRQTNDTPSDKRKEVPLAPPNGSLPCTSPSFTPYNPPQEKEESPITDVLGDKKRDKPASVPPDLSFVLDLWNSFATRSVPKIRSLSPARKEKVKLRIKEMGGMDSAKTTLAECFKKISESDFCTGATGKWAANFDWFFENEKNWLKVLEGNYDNRKEKTQLEIFAENVAKADAYYEQRYHGYGGASPYGDQTGSGHYGPDEQ